MKNDEQHRLIELLGIAITAVLTYAGTKFSARQNRTAATETAAMDHSTELIDKLAGRLDKVEARVEELERHNRSLEAENHSLRQDLRT